MTIDEANRIADDICNAISDLIYISVRVGTHENSGFSFYIYIQAKEKDLDQVKAYALLTGLVIEECLHVYMKTYGVKLG